MQIDETTRNAMVDSLTGLINSGTVQIYEGTPPGVANPPVGTLLATLTLGNPAFQPAGGGAALANPVGPDSSADATGIAQYYRVLDSGGNARHEGSVSTTAGTGDMKLVDIAIQAGEPVEITSWSINQPEGAPA